MKTEQKSAIIVAAIALLGLTGCATVANNSVALMRGPTGDTQMCRANEHDGLWFKAVVERCVELYTKAGYVKVQ